MIKIVLLNWYICLKANYCKGYGEYTGIYKQWYISSSYNNQYFERKCFPTYKTKLLHKNQYRCTDLTEYGEKKIQWYTNKKLTDWHCFDNDCSLKENM